MKEGTCPFYPTWAGIKRRYLNQGIKLYEPWINDYRAFARYVVENLGPRPEGMRLCRIGKDGNYEPGNLRWA